MHITFICCFIDFWCCTCDCNKSMIATNYKRKQPPLTEGPKIIQKPPIIANNCITVHNNSNQKQQQLKTRAKNPKKTITHENGKKNCYKNTATKTCR